MTMTWTIHSGPQLVEPYADHTRYQYVLERGEDTRDVFVEISNTAAAVDPATLPSPIDEAVKSKGETLVARNLHRLDPPVRIAIHSRRWTITRRHGCYEDGYRVWV